MFAPGAKSPRFSPFSISIHTALMPIISMKKVQLRSLLKAICPLFLLCSFSIAQQSGEDPAPSQPLSGTEAAAALVQRVTPEYSGRVTFNISKKLKKTTIAAKDAETIVISAPSVFECARGYGYYLRNVARVHLSWNGDNRSAARFIVPKKTIVVPEAQLLHSQLHRSPLEPRKMAQRNRSPRPQRLSVCPHHTGSGKSLAGFLKGSGMRWSLLLFYCQSLLLRVVEHG